MNFPRRILTVTIAASVLVLAGCTGTTGSDTTSGHDGHGDMPAPSEAAVDANAADLMFAGMMIGHHQQAIQMSDLLLAKSDVDPGVAELAQRIKAAQAPEIEQLTGWVTAWGGDAAAYEGMDHGDGMMSPDDLAALEAAPGPEASVLFLEQMIVHHEGAVTMAEDQISSGQNADAVALAEKIVSDQTSEIAEMKEILAALK